MQSGHSAIPPPRRHPGEGRGPAYTCALHTKLQPSPLHRFVNNLAIWIIYLANLKKLSIQRFNLFPLPLVGRVGAGVAMSLQFC
jgi:hypothetical protein